MRWKQKPPIEVGRERVITKFLLFPRCIDGVWRWLEKAKVRQVRSFFETSGGCVIHPNYYWKWVAWIDE